MTTFADFQINYLAIDFVTPHDNSPQTGNKHLLHQYSKSSLDMIQTIIVLLVLFHKLAKFLNSLYHQVK